MVFWCLLLYSHYLYPSVPCSLSLSLSLSLSFSSRTPLVRYEVNTVMYTLLGRWGAGYPGHLNPPDMNTVETDFNCQAQSAEKLLQLNNLSVRCQSQTATS